MPAAAGTPGWRDWLRLGLTDRPGERVSGWQPVLARQAGLSELFAAGQREFSALLGACPEIRHVVHGDLLNRNVLVAPDGFRLTAVFDRGCSTYGDFLYEVAWFTFWAPWHPGLAAIDFRPVIRRHYDATGVDLPGFGERLRCYELHIGLTHLAYCAFAGRPWSVRHPLERLGYHQGVVADGEFRVVHGAAHVRRVPELLVPGPPVSDRGVSLALAEGVN